MNNVRLTRAKQSLVRDLDRTLQTTYHQRLGEVLNDLRMHNIDLSPNPSPDEILSTVRRTHILWSNSLPQMVQMRESIERVFNGSYGICARCGQPIGEDILEANPEALNCWKCAR